jgi:PAS domain S-box-containing protein
MRKQHKVSGRRSSRRASPSHRAAKRGAKPPRAWQPGATAYEPLPALQLIYDTAPVGLAFLTPDCRYLQINQRLTEICGISVAEHIGRTVRETVPQVADDVERIVASIMRTGQPVTGVEVRGQRADGSNADHVWITSWHPLKKPDGAVIGINVVAEDVTERKRAEAVLVASETALRDSEARFRELADNIDQFAWTADHTGWIYWYNKRWHDYTGTTLAEMQGWGWRKVHHPDHVDRVVERISRSFATGKPWEDVFPLRGRDGRYRWFLSRALPIRDGDGEVVRWFGTNTDVTERIKAEEALRELNETLEQRVATETRERLQIWTVSQDLLVIADLSGNCLGVNPAWTATLGWPEHEVVGKPYEWLVHPDDLDRARAELANLVAGSKTLHFEARIRHRNGSYRWLSWKAVPDRGRIYAMGQDVTELKAAESELRQARQELGQAAQRAMLAATTASIAHEIKQPLGAIVANAEAALRWLARTPPGLDDVREMLSDIAGDGVRAAEIIQSVRAMFVRGEPDDAPLDVGALIDDTVAIVRGEIEAAGITLRVAPAAALPRVTAHRGQLQQVILNLVANAVDAMRANGQENGKEHEHENGQENEHERVLAIRAEPLAPDGVAMMVEDTGAGVAPEDHDRIFTAFFTTKSDGMGMGLAICRSIVEAHGGRLTVAARVPRGSAFRVELPGGR